MRYIEPKELYDEYKKSKEDESCTERLGELFILLTDHLLQSASFRRYPVHVKQDMKSYALYKLVRSVQTVKLSMSPKQIFNYCTRSAWVAFITEIQKYYKVINLQRDLEMQALLRSDFLDPRIKNSKIEEIQRWDDEVKATKAKNAKQKSKKKNLKK